MAKPVVRTGVDGRFVLESERVLTLIPWGGWASLDLAFRMDGYQTLKTNYSSTTFTNQPNEKASLDVGQVFLHPDSK
jgi:hypothetical protein